MAKNAKRHKPKPSQKLAWVALAWGALAAGGLYWLWSGMYWWVYLVVGLVVWSSAFKIWLEMEYQRKILDGD